MSITVHLVTKGLLAVERMHLVALAVAGGAETVLTLAVIAVAVLSLHTAIAVLLACNDKIAN